MDDLTLLRCYARNRDEAAFSELVRRHADLVYSAARRQVGDHHRAQEVTQSVFLALARKAGSLVEHPVLAACGAATKLGAGFTLFFMGKMKIGAVAVAAAGLASLATYLSLRPQSPVPASVPSNVRASTKIVPRPPANAGDDRVARLERDSADLRARLAEAAAELEKRTAELERANRKLAELRRPLAPGNTHMSSSTLKATTKPGEVIVTGGSRMADGKRMFAFVDPRVIPLTNRKGSQVEVEAKLIALPDEFVKELGLDNLTTSAANTLQQGEVWTADEVARVMERLKKDAPPGADIVSTPKVTLLTGNAGEIDVGQENERGEFSLNPAIAPAKDRARC